MKNNKEPASTGNTSELFGTASSKSKNSTITLFDAIKDFQVILQKNDLGCPSIYADKGIQRFKLESDKGNAKSGWYIFHTIFIWVNYALMTYAVFFAIPEISGLNLTFVDALFILIVGGVGMSLPAPGGVGSYHYFVSAALMIYGITKETSIVFATIAHEAQALLVIVLGIISLIILSIKSRKNKQNYAKQD